MVLHRLIGNWYKKRMIITCDWCITYKHCELIINKMKIAPQQGENQPELGRNYSNLIYHTNRNQFTTTNRSSPCTKRAQSILVLRGTNRKSTKSPMQVNSSADQVLQLNQDQKINVINLMKGNNAVAPKLKSHYCKKITLSNLDKYYDYCVKNVRSIVSRSLDIKPNELRKNPQLDDTKQQSKRPSVTSDRYRKNHKNEKQDFQPERKSTQSFFKLAQETFSGNHSRVQFNGSHLTNVKPCQHKKINYSSFCRRRYRMSKHHSPQNKKEKDEFKLNGWETPELTPNWQIP